MAFKPRTDHCYGCLFKTLSAGCSLEELRLELSRHRVVTFNYDRSLEYYLENAIVRKYGCDTHTAHDIFSALRIIHVYGSLGGADGMRSIPYGAPYRDCFDFLNHHDIRTYSELASDNVRAQIINAFKKSESMTVIGFGFLQSNNNLISECFKDANIDGLSSVFATACGVSPEGIREVEYVFGKMVRGVISNQDLCDAERHNQMIVRNDTASAFFKRMAQVF